jgi:hypothetical protein
MVDMIWRIGASTNCDPSARGRGTPGRGCATVEVTCQLGSGLVQPRRIVIGPTCLSPTLLLGHRLLLGYMDPWP